MKKLIIIIMMLGSLFLTSCTNDKNTTWIDFDLPYIATNTHNGGMDQFFAVEILDTKIVEGFNGKLNIELSTPSQYENAPKNSMLGWSFNSDGDIPLKEFANTKIIPKELFETDGEPFRLFSGRIKLKIHNEDLEYMQKLCVYLSNHLYVRGYDILNGQINYGTYPLNEMSIVEGLKKFNEDDKKRANGTKKELDLINTKITKLTDEITKPYKDTKDKVMALNSWLYNVEPVDVYKIEDASKVSITKLIEEKKGNCNSQSYFMKVALDHLGIENMKIGGIVYDNDPNDGLPSLHALNAVKLNKSWDCTQEWLNNVIQQNRNKKDFIKMSIDLNKQWLDKDWIFVDSTTNDFDNPVVYISFIANDFMTVEELTKYDNQRSN